MDKLRIRGGNSLNGQIPISGAKNAALPLMAATLLTGEPVHLGNLPDLADIRFMMQMLEQHGTSVKPPRDGGADWPGRFTFHAPVVTSTEAPYDLVRKMRASVLVLGPLLGREGRATVSLPGGCAIGNRPVDLHIKGLTEIGGELELINGNIEARAPGGRLAGGKVLFPVVSVGATENVMTAATLAKGETVMVNAAREPEIVDLANFLNAMGAKIEGQGTDTIHIQGVDALHGAEYSTVSDRIEAGTYAIAVAITGGDVELVGASTDTIESVVDTLKAAGVEVEETRAGLRVKRNGHQVKGVDVMTEPYPGFPTDLQAQMMVLMATAEGASMITETIFENRFQHVPELGRMGANINVHHASAMVRGVEQLTGAPVMATDLRASVSLVLAGLAAEGVTEVNRVYHLDRGYERLVEKLSACGADIERVSGDDADDLGAAVAAIEVA